MCAQSTRWEYRQNLQESRLQVVDSDAGLLYHPSQLPSI